MKMLHLYPISRVISLCILKFKHWCWSKHFKWNQSYSNSHDTYIPTFIWYIFSTIIVSTKNIHWYNLSVFQHYSLIINNRFCSLYRDWFKYPKNTTSIQIYKNKALSNLKTASNVTTIYIRSLILTCITGTIFFTSITFLLQTILLTEFGDLLTVQWINHININSNWFLSTKSQWLHKIRKIFYIP